MANAQVVQVADAIAAAILAEWQVSLVPPSGSDAVTRVYEVPVADPEFVETFLGRQVWVFPSEYGGGFSPVTRGIDNLRPRIAVVIAERYTSQAPVPNSWLDVRTAFVEQIVYAVMADQRRAAMFPGLIPEADGAQVVVYDAELLIHQRLFLSMVTVQYKLLYP